MCLQFHVCWYSQWSAVFLLSPVSLLVYLCVFRSTYAMAWHAFLCSKVGYILLWSSWLRIVLMVFPSGRKIGFGLFCGCWVGKIWWSCFGVDTIWDDLLSDFYGWIGVLDFDVRNRLVKGSCFGIRVWDDFFEKGITILG